MPENQPVQSISTGPAPQEEPIQPEVTPIPPEKKKKPWLVIGLATLLMISLGTTGYLAFQNYQLKKETQTTVPEPYPIETKPTLTPTCMDSNDMCRQKPDGTSCTTGLWCDEMGRVCGGGSCVGMGTGKCLSEKCISEKSTAGWEIYSSSEYGFSINYPDEWRVVELENWVIFGPKEIGEDTLWGISIYDKSEKTISEIKDELGQQFSDRKQTEETITVNGLTASKVITTTNEIEGWYLVTIIAESENKLYAIGNGAQTDLALNEFLLKRTEKEYDLSFEGFYKTFKLQN